MEVRASTRFVRVSPQKARMVIEVVKGQPVEHSLNLLKFMPQKAAGIIEKTIRSAVANADQQNLDVDTLVVRNIVADQGPMLKRYRARARGRGSRILKRTSHITVTLAERVS